MVPLMGAAVHTRACHHAFQHNVDMAVDVEVVDAIIVDQISQLLSYE